MLSSLIVLLVGFAAGGQLASRGAEISVRTLDERKVTATIEVVGETSQALTLETPGRLPLSGFGEEARLLRLRTIAEGYWAPDTYVASDTESKSVSLLPLTSIRGTLALESRSEIPSELNIRFSASATDAAQSRSAQGDRLSGEMPCDLEGLEFSCSVPIGTWDLRIRVPGCVASYLWDQQLSPEAPLDAGRLRVAQGASVIGWIATHDGGSVDDTASVALSPSQTGVTDLSIASYTVQPSDEGFFQFGGVAPGSYTIEATQDGYSVASVEGIEVFDLYEAELPSPIILAPPSTMRLTVEPAITSDNEPWSLTLVRVSAAGNQLIGHFEMDQTGFWESKDLENGDYLVRVSGGEGDPIQSSVVSLDGYLEKTIRSERIDVAGSVSIGSRPLAASLAFESLSGEERFTVASGEEGRFLAQFSSPGEWRVKVTAEEPPVVRKIGQLQVDEQDTRLDLELPDTKISGRVLLDGGPPPFAVSVEARPVGGTDDRVWTVTNPGDGSFSFSGFPVGEVEVSARDLDSSHFSDSNIVRLATASSRREIRLQLARGESLTGTVFANSGPVPGATVTAYPMSSHISLVETVTDAAGMYSLMIPENTSALSMRVAAPGYSLKTTASVVPEEREINLAVSAEGGTLLLEYPANRFDWVHLKTSGGALSSGNLAFWARLHGTAGWSLNGELRVPRLHPGVYFACLTPPYSPAWFDIYLSPNVPEVCERFSISPNGETDVELQEDSED